MLLVVVVRFRKFRSCHRRLNEKILLAERQICNLKATLQVPIVGKRHLLFLLSERIVQAIGKIIQATERIVQATGKIIQATERVVQASSGFCQHIIPLNEK